MSCGCIVGNPDPQFLRVFIDSPTSPLTLSVASTGTTTFAYSLFPGINPYFVNFFIIERAPGFSSGSIGVDFIGADKTLTGSMDILDTRLIGSRIAGEKVVLVAELHEIMESKVFSSVSMPFEIILAA